MITMQAVTKQFRTPAGTFSALRSIDLDVSPGERVALVGRSGSGKSTLLNLIGGIDRPTSGEITVDGTDLHRATEAELTAWRGRTVGFVFQFFQLLPTLTADENVQLPMDFVGKIDAGRRRARARELLDRVGLASKRDQLPASLSGGEQQRVAIARALANDPPVVLADEPTGNLDSETAERVLACFRDLARGGVTLVVATHDPEIARTADRVVEIRDGAIAGGALVGTDRR